MRLDVLHTPGHTPGSVCFCRARRKRHDAAHRRHALCGLDRPMGSRRHVDGRHRAFDPNEAHALRRRHAGRPGTRAAYDDRRRASLEPVPAVNESKRRLFVGIALDADARAACAAVAQRLERTGFAATLRGAGETPRHARIPGLRRGRAVRRASFPLSAPLRERHAFSVTLDKLGGFPHERRPRIVYVGAREHGARFRALADSVRRVYAALGFEFKNDSVAHVTIARVKAPNRPLPLIEFAADPAADGAPYSIRIAARPREQHIPLRTR